jgi:hypothetical protein
MILVLLAIIVVALAIYPVQTRQIQTQGNFGFGPEWDCVWPGEGGPVCVKSSKMQAVPRATVNQ